MPPDEVLYLDIKSKDMVMSCEITVDNFVNKEIKRHELVKRRENEEGKSFLLVQLEPILNRKQQSSSGDLNHSNDDPFERLRSFK